MTALHVWAKGDGIDHNDLNLNFSACANAVGFSLTVFNVRNYGALGDGTDQTVAINACVAAAKAAANGARIYFPAGAYTYSGAAGIVLDQSFLSIEGDGIQTTNLTFANGAGAGITLGKSATGTRDQFVRDLRIGQSGKTAGAAITVINTYEVLISRIRIESLDGVNIGAGCNSTTLRDVTIISLAAGYNTFGIWWNCINDGSTRSDVLTLHNVTINGAYTTTGILWEGMCNTLSGVNVRMVSTNRGILVKHWQGTPSSSFYPAFGNFFDLEIDGAKTRALEIQCGASFKFVGCDIDNATGASGQGSADLDTISIAADTGGSGSFTRAVTMHQMRVGSSQQRGIFCDARDCFFSDINVYSLSQSGVNAFPAIEFGANALNVAVYGTRGSEFGSSLNTSYAVKLAVGASRVVLAGINGTYDNLGAVQNLSGNATNTVLATIEPSGVPTNWTTDGLGTAMLRYDTTAGAQLRVQNTTVGAGVLAGWVLVTGTASSFMQGYLHDNNGTPYWIENAGSAVVTRYSDMDTQNWRASNGTQRLKLDSNGLTLAIALAQNFANDAAAAAGGIAIGGVYRNGSVLMIRVT